VPHDRDGRAAGARAGARTSAVPAAAADPATGAGAAAGSGSGAGGDFAALTWSPGPSLLGVAAHRLMPAAEVLARAADLVSTVGLHAGEPWPGAHTGQPYVHGQPVCAVGAVVVIRGARTPSEAIALMDHRDPAIRALIGVVGGRDTACVAHDSDRWARRGRLGRRVVAWALRRAARPCRA
jgi:hypothetical protein